MTRAQSGSRHRQLQQCCWQQLDNVAHDPVPAPMPVLGGLAALGWSRRLRLRLRQNSEGQG